MRKVKGFLIALAVFLLIGIGVFIYIGSLNNITVEYKVTATYKDSLDIKVNAESENFLNSILWIALDNNSNTNSETQWELFISDLTYRTNGDYLHIKDEKENTVNIEIVDNMSSQISFIEPILAYPIDYQLEILTNSDDSIILYSSNDNVAKIINNKVVTSGKGIVTITAIKDDYSKSIEINVTDKYTLPNTDSEHKPFLKELVCTQDEAHMLDDILEMKINNAGYKTRAGVVAAARFLSLEFPYKLTYFSESGRLDSTTGTAISDGEGRYYHKGLYLSEDKFFDLKANKFGKATWGEFFEKDDSDDHSIDDYYLYDGFVPADIGSHLYLSKRPNGLDCSGFVAWCYYNGGFDFGDMGAGGPGTYGMTNLGELVYINDELLKSDKIKAGDLVGFASHVGIVIGVDDDYIWIADTLITGLKVTKYERNVQSFEALGEDAFKYFMLMDKEYLDDGNYSAMWN